MPVQDLPIETNGFFKVESSGSLNTNGVTSSDEEAITPSKDIIISNSLSKYKDVHNNGSILQNDINGFSYKGKNNMF